MEKCTDTSLFWLKMRVLKKLVKKCPKIFWEIDLGGVRMGSYGSVWTRMGPYGP